MLTYAGDASLEAYLSESARPYQPRIPGAPSVDLLYQYTSTNTGGGGGLERGDAVHAAGASSRCSCYISSVLILLYVWRPLAGIHLAS